MSQQTDRLNTALAGRYRIERHLGEGGMATVYLCEDLKHDRKVALKLLKPELAAVLGAERFVQEIKTTAALQHPHILPLFDSGATDGFLFYVMPFIDGETLRAKLDRETQLGVDDAVRIAREVADALHYAHERGIVHRDVKPENILLHGGHAMVADFGIALAVSAAAGGRMTETGLSLGTPHYMSPEQATAEKEITARSDVYSIASVLFEMLTGNPPHTGASAQQIIMKIITEAPQEVTALRKSVPANVAAAIAKSLEKLPADRFESAKAFADALGNSAFVGAAYARSGAAAAARATPFRRALLPTVALGTGALGFALATMRQTADRVDRPSAQFVLSAAPSLTPNTSRRNPDLAISPDGRRVAYLAGAGRGIYVRAIDSLSGWELAGTDGATSPVFSPDGQWIAYHHVDRVMKISVRGGPVIPLGEIRGVVGMSWEISDTLVLGTYNALVALPSTGGKPMPLTRTDTTNGQSMVTHRWPTVLPGGRVVIFNVPMAGGVMRLALLDRKTGEEHSLDQQGSYPRWSPTGHIIYSVGRVLWALPFDPVHLRATGDPVPVLDGVATKATGAADFAIARDDGALVYATEGASSNRVLVWIDATGRITPIEGIASRTARDPRISPDGRTVLYGDDAHLFMYDIRRATSTQLTRDSTNNYAALFTPDGQRVVFSSTRSGNPGLYVRRVDGDGADTLLDQPAPLVDQRAMAITGDGSQLLVTSVPTTVLSWMSVRDLKGNRVTGSRDFVRNTVANDYPSLSPDGHWVAFRAGSVIVSERFPEGGQRQQLSEGAAQAAAWSRDGRTVYYVSGDSLMAVSVRGGAALLADRPRLLFRAPFAQASGGMRVFDVGPDGRFVAVLAGEIPGAPTGTAATTVSGSVVFVQNWTNTLRRRLARP